MTARIHGDPLRLLFDWAHEDGRRLAFWVFVAVLLHAGAWLLFQVRYPPPQPARITDASLYVLLPGSAEARRLAPFLASADPSLLAPERADRLGLPAAKIPDYVPSYDAAAPELVILPDPPNHLLPPLIRDFGPVPMADAPAPAPPLPAPVADSQIVFSASLQSRAPTEIPRTEFTARTHDVLPPTRFLLAVAPDGQVRHVLRESPSTNDALEDAAAGLLMRVRFKDDPGSVLAWGTATLYWGLDVERADSPGKRP